MLINLNPVSRSEEDSAACLPQKNNFAAGQRAFCPRCGCPSKNRGFTLMELLIVIALIGVTLVFAIPTTREALTVNSLKKTTRLLVGLERQLRSEAVRDQTDYILVLNISDNTYYVMSPDMTPEKLQEVEKRAQKLPGGVVIRDIVKQKNEKISQGKVEVLFARNNISPPLVIHLADGDEAMTLVINPFLGVTALYDHYADISVDDGMGRDTSK
jgi:prepilin-type N-terminal cleavage/methylation domain-containing protein